MHNPNDERVAHAVANLVALAAFAGVWLYAGITTGLIGVAAGVASYYFWLLALPCRAGMLLIPLLARHH